MVFFKKRDVSPAPSWVKWLLLAFVVYAVISGGQKGSQTHEAFNRAKQELDPQRFFNPEDYKKAIFPGYSSTLQVKEIEAGKGPAVVCGQQVTLAYTSFTKEGEPLADIAPKDKPITFRIGEGKVVPALEQGVLGMSPGGRRDILSPAPMAYGAAGFARSDMPSDVSIKFDLELLEAAPELPDINNSPFRIAGIQGGTGAFVSCGGSIKAHVTVWDVAGRKLYSTKDPGNQPISFSPGKSEVFFGLEQGVLGMSPGSARTLIVPPDFQQTVSGNPPSVSIPLPSEQTVLVDVEALP